MEKRFKKLLLLIFVFALMVMSLTACSSNKEEKDVSSEGTAEQFNGDIKDALKGVELSVGTSGLFAPFSYYDVDGTTLIGYDLDFLNALQDLLGFTIKGDKVEAMDYSALTTSVANGKLDIALAALCATNERKEVMNFSSTYYDSGQITVINKENSSKEITNIDSLKSDDYKVAVEKGTASHIYAQANLLEDSIEVHDTITTAYESLEQGKVDALIQDTPGIAFYIKTKEDTKLVMVGDEFNQGQAPYAVAISFDVSEKNSQIVDIFNKAIEELTKNGTMDKIKSKWAE